MLQPARPAASVPPSLHALSLLFLLWASALGLRAQSLQSYLTSVMRGRHGAVLVSNPTTGQILAVWNRTTVFRQTFSPGSAAKLVEAAGLLEDRKISVEDRIVCRRVPELLGEPFHCSHALTGFPFTIKSALAFSCNYFFAAMSVRLPPSDLAHWYGVFGFGTPVDGGGPGANPGSIRIPENDADKARAALGEATVLVTPAQLLLAYSAIAMKGSVYRLWTRTRRPRPTVHRLRKLEFRPETFDTLNAAFEECVRTGTGQGAAVTGIGVAGKTGTGTALDGSGVTHAWFVGYAPASAPEIALVVFLERGTGASDAAPVAGQILKYYFALKSKHVQKARLPGRSDGPGRSLGTAGDAPGPELPGRTFPR